MGIGMFRKVLSFLLLLCLVACAAPTAIPVTPTPSGDRSEVEELAVYAAALDQLYSASAYVLFDTTATDESGIENTAQTLDYVLQNMHDVATETINSFRSRNETTYPLPADMDLGLEYTLLSQAEKNQIFGQNQSGWEVFYGRYPDAPGLTTLSRVGFNAAFDQALVYVGTQSDWLAGAGYYVLLEKTQHGWMVNQKVMTWVS